MKLCACFLFFCFEQVCDNADNDQTIRTLFVTRPKHQRAWWNEIKRHYGCFVWQCGYTIAVSNTKMLDGRFFWIAGDIWLFFLLWALFGTNAQIARFSLSTYYWNIHIIFSGVVLKFYYDCKTKLLTWYCLHVSPVTYFSLRRWVIISLLICKYSKTI